MVDLLSKVSVNRGSLIKSIENLLKTIESSENSVMIPTLLRDKCEFDAWELLFVAKILKASILGHSDLVEFYMNHIGHASTQFPTSNGNIQKQQLEAESLASVNNSLSPGATRLQSPTQAGANSPVLSTSSLGSSAHLNGASKSSQQTSWATAASSNGLNQPSNSSSLTSNSSEQPPTSPGTNLNYHDCLNEHLSLQSQSQRPAANQARQVQPSQPSLLQLTTNNNHLNSLSAGASVVESHFTNDDIEQLTNQLESMQQQQQATILLNSNNLEALSISTGSGPTNTAQHTANLNTSTQPTSLAPPQNTSSFSTGSGSSSATTPTAQSAGRPEPPDSLRVGGRSATSLFRISSGASSPRTPNGGLPPQTPTTPYPQAETLANGLSANGQLQGDPSAPVKLLLQIEQLKSSISHVTHLLESVVELYKKSIDNIA